MNQRGYSLLLSLFILLGLGGLLVSGLSVQHPKHTQQQPLALSKARTALISYAVNYIDHYGGQGAGIGHFPCPDTDEPGVGGLDNWHLDGPNPPCSSDDVAIGWLPRHVNVTDGRYHFHTRSRQRLLYAVSGSFVNNPVNRVVNPASTGDIEFGLYNDVVAIIIAPRIDGGTVNIAQWINTDAVQWIDQSVQYDSGAAYALIHASDFRLQAMRRVGSWLVNSLNDALQQRCQRFGLNQYCASAQRATKACELPVKDELLYWLSTQKAQDICGDGEGDVDNGNGNEKGSAKGDGSGSGDNNISNNYSSTDSEAKAKAKRRSEHADSSDRHKRSGGKVDIEVLKSKLVLLDNVPVARHWFIRNEWYRFVDMEFDSGCSIESNQQCRFVLLSIAENKRLLRLRLEPVPE